MRLLAGWTPISPYNANWSIAMARYSPELLAALRHRYEDTDQPMNALAAEFEIGVTTLQTLARKNGWTPRSQRLRHCPPLLAAPLLPPEHGGPEAEAEPDSEATLLLAESQAAAPESTPASVPPSPAPGAATLSKAERLEALVEKEIAAEEATRAALGIRPRSRNEAERCARTISKLTQTLQTIQKLRGDSGADGQAHDEPQDIEAFREKMALRLRGILNSRIGSERLDLDRQIAGLTDDELRQLIQIGRERGIRALLAPPDQEDASSIPAAERQAL